MHPWIRKSLLALCLFVLTACAAPRPAPLQPTWRCDPASDEAVEKGEWEKAITGHEAFLARSPNNCLALYHLGYIWGQIRDRQREIHYYREALKCGYTDDDRLYFNLGMALADEGDLDQAEAAFKKAIEMDPETPDNHFGLGLVYMARSERLAAEKAWLDSVAADPEFWEARLALVRLYLEQSRWDEAREQLDAIEAGDPDNEEAKELRQLLRSRQMLEF